MSSPADRSFAKSRQLLALAACGLLAIGGLSLGPARAGATDIGRAPAEAWLLTGVVRLASGQPQAGATVTAKLAGGPLLISVFTDEAGRFYFPPLPSGGRYVVTAQVVGHQRAIAEASVGKGVNRVDLALGGEADPTPQLSPWQQMASLPEGDRAERRGKAILLSVCASCHGTSRIFTKRFDARGWSAMIDAMPAMFGAGPESAPPSLRTHRDELAAYLAKVAGPNSAPLKAVVDTSPKGDARYSVVYEYVLSNGQGGYPIETGNNWSEGPPITTGSGVMLHDATVDLAGDLWFSSPLPIPGRTVGKIDGVTGTLTSVSFPGEAPGTSGRSHPIITAQDGTVWFSYARGRNLLHGQLGFVDPKSGEARGFPVPAGLAPTGGWVNEDAKGGIWASTGAMTGGEGALRFDRKTERYEQFKSLRDGFTYGVAGDRDGNGWWAQILVDTIGYVDRSTGKVGEITMPFTWNGVPFLKPGDMTEEEYLQIVPTFGGAGAAKSQMPRRMKADLHADVVWVANYTGSTLMRIDTKTRRTAYYPVPGVGMRPYDVGIDRKHRVWVGLQNADEVLRFDPDTRTWTLYPLPTRGVAPRSIVVVERAGRTEVVLPANDSGKVVRLIPRTAEDQQALKARYYGGG